MNGNRIDDDHALVTRLRAGDEAAFSVVVTAWTPAMFAMALRFVHTREEADDAVQDTWLAVIAGIEGFEGRSSLHTWVLSILVRKAQRVGRRDRRSVTFTPAWLEDHSPRGDPARFLAGGAVDEPHARSSPSPRWDSLPASRAEAGELHAIVDRAIAELPRRQQQVVIARIVWGCDAIEVCSMLSLSANHQRVLLHRARSHVRIAVERYLGG